MRIAQIGIIGSGISFDADVQSWLNRGTALGYILPSVTVQNALSDFVKSLKLNGLFSRMKTGYIMHAGSAQMATLNLKNPLTYQSTLVNSPTFLEGNGIKSNGTTSYIDTPFKSNEYAGIESDLTAINYVSESSTVAVNEAAHGFVSGSSRFFILFPKRSASGLQGFHYTSELIAASADYKALYTLTYSAGNVVVYRDGVKATSAIASLAPTLVANRFILAYSNAGTPTAFFPKYLSVDFLFDSFSDTDESNFRTAFNTYKTAVGLP